MIWILTLLFILTIVFAYTTFNLLRKIELYESSIDEFEVALDEQETLISESIGVVNIGGVVSNTVITWV